jgi:amino acid transporter
MDGEVWWYIFAIAVVMATTPLIAGALRWALEPPRSRRKSIALLEIVGFLVAILMFAWLLDSRRVEYHEWALWILLGIGALGVGLLEWTTHKEKHNDPD